MERALVQFLAVAESGSFSTASENLLVSQPALTYSIQKLEKRLGVKLFKRTARGVRLTSYGETLHNKTMMMNRLYTNALEEIERQRVEKEEGISIGTGYSTWVRFLKDYVVDHYAKYPNAPINVSIGNKLRCMEQLLVGDISLFVGHEIPNLAQDIQVDFIPLGLAIDGYYVRKGHPLLGAPQTLEQIYSWPTTMTVPAETRHQHLLTDVDSKQPDRRGHALTSNSLEACVSFVSSTDAVLIHTNLLTEFYESRNLERILVAEGEQPDRWLLGIYVLRERRRDPWVVKIIHFIKEKSKELDLLDAQA